MDPQLSQHIKETPARPKSVHTDFSYQAGNIAKIPVADDLDFSVPLITIDDFLEFLAPPQPKFNLDMTMKSLNKDPNCILPSGRWRSFDKDPKDQQELEDVVFSPMTDIFNKVVDAIIANSELKSASMMVEFLHQPNKSPVSSATHNQTRPDGYLVLKNRLLTRDVSWADILLPCEYKRKDNNSDLYDVSIQLGF